jgi:hypothetical protein
MSHAWGELDHIIFFCDVGAPEADSLKERGLHEGPTNSHPGQGTANRRFFFPNVYLELLWVENPLEARSSPASTTQLWDRWSRRKEGSCPFGLVFRPGGRTAVAPIAAIPYSPRYFPAGFTIDVASGLPQNEPPLFFLPFARAALVEDSKPAGDKPAVGAIVGVTLHLPGTAKLSPALDALVAAGVISIEPAREYLLEVLHVGGSTEFIDLRPALPLRFVPARRARAARP